MGRRSLRRTVPATVTDPSSIPRPCRTWCHRRSCARSFPVGLLMFLCAAPLTHGAHPADTLPHSADALSQPAGTRLPHCPTPLIPSHSCRAALHRRLQAWPQRGRYLLPGGLDCHRWWARDPMHLHHLRCALHWAAPPELNVRCSGSASMAAAHLCWLRVGRGRGAVAAGQAADH